MPIHKERRHVRHSPDQMYDLVMDVKSYPEFLPWCTGTRIRSEEHKGAITILTADLIVAFKAFRESFTSRVEAKREIRHINIEYLDGPFKYLHNRWVFEQNDDGSCTIDFYIDFQFKSKVLQVLISSVFEHAVKRMVNAFETRADKLYG